ncbi:hypothetical protein TrRE_jg460, partial [Triparma retinervis]
LEDANPFGSKPTFTEATPEGVLPQSDGGSGGRLQTYEATGADNLRLVGKLLGGTLALAYAVKYGSLYFDLPFEPNELVGGAAIVAVPALVAGYYAFGVPSGSAPGSPAVSLSFSSVKKYGVAGTVAYVITEVMFWALAFPAAGAALYGATGHWPDAINDAGDRAKVMGFVFAGANIARLAVPVRLGAAMALAPWVDKNLINRGGEEGEE